MRRCILAACAMIGFGTLNHAVAGEPLQRTDQNDAGAWLRACIAGLPLQDVGQVIEACDLKPIIEACARDSNYDMRFCARAKYDAWMTVVEETYQVLVTHFETQAAREPEWGDGERLRRLGKAQSDWSAHMDSQCLWEGADYLGGSGETTNIIAYRAVMAAERGRYLLHDAQRQLGR